MKKYQHYIDARGEVLPTPHRNNDCCCDLLIDIFQLHHTLRFVRQRRLTLDLI